METSNVRSLAKESRLLLMDGVMHRLSYWGFTEDGENDQDLKEIQGGYTYRGRLYTDTQVPKKWKNLKKRLVNKLAVEDLLEEASYTWFNRLMAIKILEANNYIPTQLAYVTGMRTPMIVQNAKKGQHSLTKQSDIDLLKEYIQEDKDELAFGLLLTDFCNKNKVLHDIFGRIDDYTEILLPQNLLQTDGIVDLLNGDLISEEQYKEVELIGWLYQFYISDKKDEVFKGFKKNKKARAEDIPAATQIFTPKWIVKYMVENTVGKLYLDYNKDSTLKEELKYYVENESDTQTLVKTENKPKSIISDLTELTLIDPAAGSGHILVTGFELLYKMYQEEGYTAKQAVENILNHNLFGLDIDDRAMQLARFAVLLKAAQYDKGILNKGVQPKIYSFPNESHFSIEELQLFIGQEGHAYIAETKEALNLLNQGKNIGSALKIELAKEAQAYIETRYGEWIELDATAELDIEQSGIWNRLKPFLDVLLVLSKKYSAVVANPPYMGQKSMNADLKNYVNANYPITKSDLMTVFMEVIPNLTEDDSRFALINLPSWMFLSSYKNLRKEYLDQFYYESLIHFGRGVFGSDFGSVAFSASKNRSAGKKGVFRKLYTDFVKVDSVKVKENRFLENDFNRYERDQLEFLKMPGYPVGYWVSDKTISIFEEAENLDSIAIPKFGMSVGDGQKFLRGWYEVSLNKILFDADELKEFNHIKKWAPIDKGGSYRKWYGNQEIIVNWQNDGDEIRNHPKSAVRSPQYFLQPHNSWTLVTAGSFSSRYFPKSFLIDTASNCIYFENALHDMAILGILNSKLGSHFLDIINPTINYSCGVVGLVPFLEDNNQDVRTKVSNCITLSTLDWDSRETSWDFEQSQLLNEANALEYAFQTWQEKVTQDFFQLHTNEEELNRIFIDIYGLQDELTPEVALKDITILQQELNKSDLEELEVSFRENESVPIELPINKAEVISQFMSYAIGVYMGRYRLDKPGLNIAHPNPTEKEMSAYQYNGHQVEIDADGIIPLMGKHCAFPDDALSLTKELLIAVWGEETLTDNINFIQECLGMDLHKWLTEKFWTYHSKKMYQKKPIYWLFSSNPKKPQNAAFKVLAYMHRMDKYSVQKIQRNYLHPHQEYVKSEIERLKADEANLSREDQKRLEELLVWQIECRDYNETLKELANQQIEFDLDDGVTVNYEKFKGAVAEIK